jgi:thiol-disulfide isomerase/thioredoxin
MFATDLFAQAYDIELIINGEKDKNALVAIYEGNNKYYVDSAVINENGKARFSGDKPLNPGMYIIITDENKIIDFLISDTVNQTFTISATKDKYLETLSFNGSPENETYAGFSRFWHDKQQKENQLIANATKSTKSMKSLDDKLALLTKQTEAKIQEIKTEYPGSLLQSLAMAMNTSRQDKNGITKKSTRRHSDEFNRHYWDNILLSDNRLQNTPLLPHLIDNYFNSVLIQTPNSIINGYEYVMTKTGDNVSMMEFITGHIFNYYLKSEMLGIESLLIHIIDNYYSTGKVNVTDEKFLKEMTDFANKNRETLVGKKATNLKMETIGGTPESLYDINLPYTLVYFFEPSCGHCKQETPKIYKVFQKFKNKGLAGFCVYTQNNKNEWLEYVAKNNLTDWINVWDPTNNNNFRIAYSIYSVPQAYLLDKDKNIIGRRLDNVSLLKMLNDLIN